MAECSCVYVDVDNYADLHEAKTRKARKEHKCNECGRTIGIRENYEHVSGLWDGRFSHYKTCMDCLSLRNEFFCEGWNYEMVHEDLTEYIQEAQGQIPEDCILRLTPGAQATVFEKIEAVWEE